MSRGFRGLYKTDAQTSRLSDEKIREIEVRERSAAEKACDAHLRDLERHSRPPLEVKLRRNIGFLEPCTPLA